MKFNFILFISLLTSVLFSCKSLHIRSREGKDLHLTSRDTTPLKGTYINFNSDDSSHLYTLWKRLNYKKNIEDPHGEIEIEPIDERNLRFSFLRDNKVVGETILKGHYRKGYFKLRDRYRAKMHFGPVLWSFAGFRIFLGVNEDGHLVLLESNAGVSIVGIFPVFSAGGRHDFKYRKKDK